MVYNTSMDAAAECTWYTIHLWMQQLSVHGIQYIYGCSSLLYMVYNTSMDAAAYCTWYTIHLWMQQLSVHGIQYTYGCSSFALAEWQTG